MSAHSDELLVELRDGARAFPDEADEDAVAELLDAGLVREHGDGIELTGSGQEAAAELVQAAPPE